MGTITDIDGNYTLDVPSGASLQVSYIGYLTQDVVTAGKNNIDINLIEDTQKLEEVVVVGYGTQRKGELTSSISSVKVRISYKVPYKMPPNCYKVRLRVWVLYCLMETLPVLRKLC